ncbi:MAG TPA: tRNA preQ1(34) S-adenosylmethionine ribosyltransferase-isomerase QueA [Candidatus Brocadiaceae bacterium]|nr:tRNA preQ1(34) S-adenosylmethionine ribosyltransferase-isomerase QueA [Candidatus Brocadiaceae bacterium]
MDFGVWGVNLNLSMKSIYQAQTQASTKLSDYDYDLPRELIAQHPLENRDDARLLILHRDTGDIEHRKFSDITDYLLPNDLLILNNTKVLPARIFGHKSSGASVELLFVEDLGENQWKALVKSNAKLRASDEIYIDHHAVAALLQKRHDDGSWSIGFNGNSNIKEILHRIGEPPLPPYIKRQHSDALTPIDRERYQTVFAQKEGAIAAPTAGLHFSNTTLEKVRNLGVELGFVTLHVGLGTFLPVKVEDIRDHGMHKEYYECQEETYRKITSARSQNRRIIATGSTSCRVLETIACDNKTPHTTGWTNLFIYPPYQFKSVDVLITNFHLPKTTLLILVSAFAGRENILHAYEAAKNEGYRFFSYGDCMMIV